MRFRYFTFANNIVALVFFLTKEHVNTLYFGIKTILLQTHRHVASMNIYKVLLVALCMQPGTALHSNLEKKVFKDDYASAKLPVEKQPNKYIYKATWS